MVDVPDPRVEPDDGLDDDAVVLDGEVVLLWLGLLLAAAPDADCELLGDVDFVDVEDKPSGDSTVI